MLNMLKQQLIGVITWSLPIIIVYNVYPGILLNPIGQLACALLLGGYVWFLNKKQHDALIKSLVYAPTGAHKVAFEELMTVCAINPETLTVRYAYTGGQIAMTASRTVIIDPVCFSLCNEDEAAIKVKDVFEKHIYHTLLPVEQTRIMGISEALTPSVERFIFKHELGHVVDNFSRKKLLNIFVSMVVAVYCGIGAGIAVVSFGGFAALVVGMVVGGLVDVSLAYVSNIFFKLPAEKRADIFAARYSSREDIQDAARFFVKHQEIMDAKRESGNFLNSLSVEMRAGYQDGKARAASLLRLAEQTGSY